MKRSWIQLRNLKNARTLLILPCNAAACIGNYFRAETYSKNGWNAWREADILLRELRKREQVAFAAVDSSTLETEPKSSIQIFIGKKSPITDSPELAIVAEWCGNQDGEILLLAIGPKRMNYKKVVKIIKGIKETDV